MIEELEEAARQLGKLTGRVLRVIIDDILILLGCLMILYGTWQIIPVATWFVGGAMLIVLGVLYGLGGKS